MGLLNDHINFVVLLASIGIIIVITSATIFYYRKMMTSKAEGKLTIYSWDGISEFTSNVPLIWAGVFTCLSLWGFWYVIIGYPLNAYSQIGEYNSEVASHNEKFEGKLKDLDHEDLAKMGEKLFLLKCSVCHGQDGAGNGGKAADLTKWSKVEGIVHVIKNGSTGLNYSGVEMPAIDMSDEDAHIVAQYVLVTFAGQKDSFQDLDIERGKKIWDDNSCAACHGEDGKGMEGFAANLTEYGTPQFLKEVLTRGKKGNIGQMPNFNTQPLNDTQIKAINAYIQDLGSDK
ncbi:MAG: c-type cytochrome [Helicobacter sp.]|nr:c-type cytochrome [Helicobacter sp.]